MLWFVLAIVSVVSLYMTIEKRKKFSWNKGSSAWYFLQSWFYWVNVGILLMYLITIIPLGWGILFNIFTVVFLHMPYHTLRKHGHLWSWPAEDGGVF